MGTIIDTTANPGGAAGVTVSTVNIASLPPLPAGTNLLGSMNLAIGGAVVSASNPVPVSNAFTQPQALNWNSATATGATNTVSVQGFAGVMISVVTASTISGGSLVFEIYDGAAWIPAQAGKMNTYGAATGIALTGNMNQGYQINTAGCSQFRTRLAGAITGTGSVTVTHQLSSAQMPDPATVGLDPAQPLPAGTNNIGIVQPAYQAPGAYTAGNAFNATAYGSVTLAVTTAPTGAWTPQWSPDGNTWFNLSGTDLNFNVVSSVGIGFTGAITFKGAGYFRLNGGSGGAFQIGGGQ